MASERRTPPEVELLPHRVGRRFGFVDTEGRTVIEPQFTEASPFAFGLAPVKVARWGFIDGRGELAIPALYDTARPFTEAGMAVVSRRCEHGTELFHIDRAGERIFGGQCLSAEDFHGPFARILDGDKRWQLLNTSGEVVAGPLPESCSSFQEDRASFRAEGGLYGYLDVSGSVAVEPRFTVAGAFSRGRAPVGVNGRLAFIDVDGGVLSKTRTKVERLGGASAGLLRIVQRVRGKLRHLWVDHEGEEAISGPFVVAGDFTEAGHAMAAVANDRRGVIDRDGSWVLQPRYWGIGPIVAGCAMVFPSRKTPSLFGWVDLESRAVVWKPASLEIEL